jgi:MFS family permease
MTGFYQMAFMLGLAISPLLGGTLTDALGFPSALLICAAVSGVGLAVALVALPETNRPVDVTLLAQQIGDWVAALRRLDPQILRSDLIHLLIRFVNGGVLMSTVSLYLQQRVGSDISLGSLLIGVSSLAGLMLTVRAVMGMLAGPVAGTLSDWSRNRWWAVRGGILLGVVGFVILALPGGLWAVPAGVALISLSAGGLAAVLAAIVGDLATGARQGTVMGTLATAGDIGSATGPLLAYWLIPVLDLRVLYLLCALAVASGLLATVGQGAQRVELRQGVRAPD